MFVRGEADSFIIGEAQELRKAGCPYVCPKPIPDSVRSLCLQGRIALSYTAANETDVATSQVLVASSDNDVRDACWTNDVVPVHASQLLREIKKVLYVRCDQAHFV